MRYGIFVLALGALWSSQVSAGDLPSPSVYVAPGGVYIASAHVHVGTDNGYPAYRAPAPSYYAPPPYAPGYVTPGQVYGAPAFHEGYRAVYPARPAYASEYTYAEEPPPRPPVPVPYNGAAYCSFNQGYGRSAYCD
jgi:hypothetical protein